MPEAESYEPPDPEPYFNEEAYIHKYILYIYIYIYGVYNLCVCVVCMYIYIYICIQACTYPKPLTAILAGV